MEKIIKALYEDELYKVSDYYLDNCPIVRDHTGEAHNSEKDISDSMEYASDYLKCDNNPHFESFLDSVNDEIEGELEAKDLLDIITKIA